MKKSVFMVFVFIATLASCSSSDNDKEFGYDKTDQFINVENLIGEWELTGIKLENGTPFFKDDCRKESRIFNRDRTTVATIKYSNSEGRCESKNMQGKWLLTNDKIEYLSPTGNKLQEGKIYKLTNRELVIFTEVEEEFFDILSIYDPIDPTHVSVPVMKTYRRK